MAESDDDIATILHAFILDGIADFSLRVLVRWAVHVDGGIVFFVEEIRAGLAALQELLCPGGQVVVVVLQEGEPDFFEVRAAKPLRLDEVFGSRRRGRRD